MIHVKVERDQNLDIQSIVVTGHAGSGPYGFDLVCAGVSAVSFGAINAVEELCGVRMIVEQSEDGGYLRCAFSEGLEHVSYRKAQLLLEGMLSSLRTIEKSYDEHIKIKDEGGGTHA